MFYKTPLHTVKDGGWDGVSLYTTNNYACSKDKVKEAFDLELPVMLNEEGDSHADLGDYTAGTFHARNGVDKARALDFDGESPYVFSLVDFNPANVAELAACLDAMHGVCDILDAIDWWVGGYGPPAFSDVLVQQDFWKNAPNPKKPRKWWQWGGGGATRAYTTWRQFQPNWALPPGLTVNNIPCTVDPNSLEQDVVAWVGFGSNPVQEDYMADIYFTNTEPYPNFPGAAHPDGQWPSGWVWWKIEAGGVKRWISNPAEADAVGQQLNAGHLGFSGLTTGKIQGLLDYVPPTSGNVVVPTIDHIDVPSVPGKATVTYK
jgi:hypothetical protein